MMDVQRTPPEDFNTLLLRLYHLAQELPIQTFQDSALLQIKQILPFDSSMWGTATTTTGGIDIHTIHLHETSPEMLEAYEGLKQYDTVAASMFGERQAIRTVNTETFYAGATGGKKEFHEFLRRFRHENTFIASEAQPHRNFVHWISMYRAEKDAHCTKDQCALLSQLAPHILQSLSLNRVIHLNRLDSADKAFSPYGFAISDARGVLHHADPQFKKMVEVEWSDWGDHILPSELWGSAGSGQESYIGRTIVIRQHVEHGLLFLKSRPRCLADQLTAREQTIARLIAKGQSHKEIAVALNRSPATVRNHIQSIYEKLQVSSIAMLVEALRQAG